MTDDALPFGPLGPRTAHLCIDMQELFAGDTPWHTPWMHRILAPVLALAEHRPEQTIFTRFIPPARPEEARGTWRRYYEKWRSVTREALSGGTLELMPPLRALVPPAVVLDKPVYSPFAGRRLPALLAERNVDTLVITGGETDVCVLATVLGAVDLGYRVVLPVDGLCSGSDREHDALLELYRERFSLQIETCTTAAVLAAWR